MDKEEIRKQIEAKIFECNELRENIERDRKAISILEAEIRKLNTPSMLDNLVGKYFKKVNNTCTTYMHVLRISTNADNSYVLTHGTNITVDRRLIGTTYLISNSEAYGLCFYIEPVPGSYEYEQNELITEITKEEFTKELNDAMKYLSK